MSRAPARAPRAKAPAAPKPARPRVALVVKRSAFRAWIEERRDARMRKLLAAGDPTVARVRASHEEHERTVRAVTRALRKVRAEVHEIGDPTRPFDPGDVDLVITVGGDGTLLATSHSIGDAPILGINSAPSHSVGFFCGARGADEVEDILARAIAGELKRAVLTRMPVSINGAVVAARVLNDALFCHASPAATSRYILELGGVVEEQKSSGFWIGPAAGSTAAQRSAGGRVLPLTSPKLQLVVREAYAPHGERYRVQRALIAPGGRLVVRSKIHDAKIFVDGPGEVVDVHFGDVVELTQAAQPLTLLGISAKRRWG